SAYPSRPAGRPCCSPHLFAEFHIPEKYPTDGQGVYEPPKIVSSLISGSSLRCNDALTGGRRHRENGLLVVRLLYIGIQGTKPQLRACGRPQQPLERLRSRDVFARPAAREGGAVVDLAAHRRLEEREEGSAFICTEAILEEIVEVGLVGTRPDGLG